ncbi:MAG: helix-turn-helix transcriptional regulator [Anaerococcus hydrogenalis]|nr:helix-turn-helix transcriptional regulator [Anaerococcus hydrogenalis]
MKTFDDYLKEQLKDPEFEKEYESIKPEIEIMKMIITARNEQKLTQKDLSKKIGMDQAEISKLENGNANPTLKVLQRVANGLNKKLEIKFV